MERVDDGCISNRVMMNLCVVMDILSQKKIVSRAKYYRL